MFEDVVYVDVLIVLFWCDMKECFLVVMVNVVCDVYVCGVIVVGLCLGVFVLVEVGVFDGYEVIMYWSVVEVFL